MKITYLTKCPKCGGSIDEEYSKFCPFCGNSLSVNEPMSEEERLKMEEYEDQAIPRKTIAVNRGYNSKNKIVGITLIASGVLMILLGLFAVFCLFFMTIGFGSSIGDFGFIIFMIISGISFLFFLGMGSLLFVIPGVICLIINGNARREIGRAVNNPDEVFNGIVRRFNIEKINSKQSDHFMYVKVDNPQTQIFECQYFDYTIPDYFKIGQKIRIYRKENKYYIKKE